MSHARRPELGEDDDWRAAIEALQDEGRRAFLAQDVRRLDELWADELRVNSPVNRVLVKSEVLELLQRGVIAHHSFEIHAESMARHGDIVVVMGHDVVTDRPDTPPTLRRFTDVWRSTGASWQLLARHANAVR